MRSHITLAAALAAALALGACGGGSGDAPGDAEVTITVGAAASLTTVFPAIAEAFEAASPGIRVEITVAGSSAIAEQIVQGAPIDVFAAAGSGPVDPLAADGLVADVQTFATNSLAIAVPPGNPGGVVELADLARVSVAVCQEPVPCGSAALALFERNSLTVTPVTLEPDVRAVLTKVSADEVDAGIVYVTDIVAAGDAVVGIAIPASSNVTTEYPIGLVTASEHLEAARAFIAFVLSDQGQRILADAGFTAP